MQRTPNSKSRIPIYARFGLKIGISAFCVWFLINHFDSRSALQLVMNADLVIFILAVLGFISLSILQTWRWLFILRALQVRDVSAKTAQEAVMVGMFFNQGLPSSLGGDAVRVWRLSHCRTSLKNVFSSVVVERLAAVMGMVLITTALLPFAADFISDSSIFWSVVFTNSIASLALVLLGTIDKFPYADKILKFSAGRVIQTISQNIRQVAFSPSAGYIVSCSIVIHFFVSMIFWLLAKGLDIQISPVVCISLVPIVLLVTTIPISVAGWGVRESVVVVLFGFVGLSSAQSIAVSLLFGTAVAVAALPGGLVLILTEKQKREISMEFDT